MTRTLTVVEAERFARKAHTGHTRNNRANTPYEYHLEEVATLVHESHGSPEEIAAAWLHDSVEDTTTTLADIHDLLGPTVASIVEHLTDLPEWKGLPTLERKTLQAARVATLVHTHSVGILPARIKRVKLADQISNVRCCTLDPPVKWDAAKIRHYIEGARRIALVCRGISNYLDDTFENEYRAAYAARIF